MPSAKTLLDNYNSARNAILDHCGVSGAFRRIALLRVDDCYWKRPLCGPVMFTGKDMTALCHTGDYRNDDCIDVLLNEHEVK